jgi:hypothetical protein
MLPVVALGVLAVATAPADEPQVGPRGIEGRVGMAAFGGQLGGAGLTGLGLHVALERRIAGGDVQVGVEGGYLGLSDPEDEVDWHGRMSRVAAVGRFRVVEGSETPVMGAWIDAGLGAERIAWERGGVLYRPEVMIGVSGTMGGVWGDRRHQGRFGDFFQVRALVSRGPGCAGRQCPSEIEMGVQVAAGFYFSE